MTDDPLPRLKARRDELRQEITALSGQLTAYNNVIALFEGRGTEPDGADTPFELPRRRKRDQPYGSMKTTVLRLIMEAKPRGLTVREIVARAAEEGIVLNLASVSGLTSRLKKDGVCVYRYGRYA